MEPINEIPILTKEELKKEYKKNYYLNNKHKFKEMIKCDVCNCSIQKYTLKRHNNLKKHQDNVLKITPQ